MKKKKEQKPQLHKANVISRVKPCCTACGTEAEVRYSNWKGVDTDKVVGKDESLCSRCFKQRMGFAFL